MVEEATLVSSVIDTLRVSVMITSFVFTTMMLVEFLNVTTTGVVAKWLGKGSFMTFLSVVSVAAIPGCLGGFTAVALFIHGVITRGVLIGGMIAASGDEAFFMLAMMPKQSLILFGFLLVYGIVVGKAVDKIFGKRFYRVRDCEDGLFVHEAEDIPNDFRRTTFNKWSALRILFLCAYTAMFFGVIYGVIGEEGWNWERITLVVTSVMGFCVIFFASDHFVDEHLIHHIAKKHLLKLFLWTLAALLFMEFIKVEGGAVEGLVKNNELLAITIAALIGLLPESGPHMIFVAGYVSGVMPFSVLVASSVVQDGHGMLPLLAESKTEFLKVKTVNLLAGIIAGLFFVIVRI